MRILYVITGLMSGGAEKQLFLLATNLPKGFEVKVCAFVDGPFREKFKEKGIEVIILERNLEGARKFLSIVEAFRPDLVHSWLPHANVFCKLCRMRKKFNLITSTRVKEIGYFHYQTLERMTDFLSYMTIVNSYTLRDFLVDGFKYKKSKVKVIYNGFEPRKPDPKSRIKKSLGIEGKKVISVIANFRRQKDFPTAVRTAKELLRLREDFCFLFVGDGKEKPNIEKMVKKMDPEKNILFLGERRDVPEILSQSDIFLLTSLYEGQSNSIIEAMFYKCPIVATNIEENREILRNGKDGLLFRTKKPKEAAEAIDRILSDGALAARLRKSSAEKAKRLFSTKEMVNSYLKVYKKFSRN